LIDKINLLHSAESILVHIRAMKCKFHQTSTKQKNACMMFKRLEPITSGISS
jgi:hypothetical protein